MEFYLSFLFFLLISSATACDRCLHQSKVSFFSKASALSSGACGYGSSATSFYGGHLAAAVPGIYKSGSGCGSCFQVLVPMAILHVCPQDSGVEFKILCVLIGGMDGILQIRCNDNKLCSKAGTRMIVTDLNKSNETDFVLSSRAFMAMANKGMGPAILKLGVANVEYKRIPCDFKGKNLAVRVEESSQKPNYLAIKILYQGGQTEIMDVDVAPVGSSNWTSMTRNHGAVWDTRRALAGPLQFRLVVTGGYDGKWIWAKSVLPADWKTGVVYDSGVQIDDIAQEGCGQCDEQIWS